MKTGALLTASVTMGARLGGASQSQTAALKDYANAIGMAFQIADDLLDVEGSTEMTGKATAKDAKAGKATLVQRMGIPGARSLCAGLIDRALGALDGFGHKADWHRWLATFIFERKQ